VEAKGRKDWGKGIIEARLNQKMGTPMYESVFTQKISSLF
jgi:hypothetical protein